MMEHQIISFKPRSYDILERKDLNIDEEIKYWYGTGTGTGTVD
jgi:hypothetical protein